MRDPAFLLFGLRPDQFSWRGLGLLALVFGGSLLGAALLAPPLYWAIQHLAADAGEGLWTYLARHPFPRYVDRLRWLPVLLALPWLLRACGLASPRALGLSHPVPARFLATAFAGGLLSLGLLALLQWLSGMVSTAPTLTPARLFGRVLPEALLSGVILGLLEETVFRGLVLRQFYSALRPWPAVLASALFFAVLHFKKIPLTVWGPDDPVTAFSGLYIAAWTVGSVFATFDFLFFLNYFLVGVVLALVTLRTRSLWAAAGLHAGWVTFLKLYPFFFAANGASHPLWGGPKVIDGLAAATLLGILAVAFSRRPKGGPGDSAPRNADVAPPAA